ncbi:uncharacterized protein LTR77_001633 [Saxophila tyrrhenica]|uniref:Opioid growth factor receptor (OGFr) conserved domain-containing protein n=1 Tax=Saxophila tyrrhenica TaxID=1690608 RepID=A0AAV9PQE9_9PEZI|nr:hypothetical protein LTR77_001633 [Saxophila tyrrhenica]
MAPQSFIINFYSTDNECDHKGRTFNDILRFNNQALEHEHDYIQVLFPLPERSPINPTAPVITPEVRAAFLDHSGLRERLVLALERMLQFYGFGLNPSYSKLEIANFTATSDIGPRAREDALIGRSPNFERRAPITWLKSMDHNHLRLTRIIRCLRVLGLDVLAWALYQALMGHDRIENVSDRTRRVLWLEPSEGDDGKGVKWLREELMEDVKQEVWMKEEYVQAQPSSEEGSDEEESEDSEKVKDEVKVKREGD